MALLPLGCGGGSEEVDVDPVDWLSTHAIRVSSVDPSDEDFADLEPLRTVIGDSRVVLLGEQSHGDGTTFLAKTRLVEFLHQEMGFSVLVFESGMYSARKAWDALQAGEDPPEAFGKGIFRIWGGSAQVQPLIAYLGEMVDSENPLELAGVDTQIHSPAAREFLVNDLESFLRSEGAPFPERESWSSVRRTFSALVENSTGIGERPPPEDQGVFLAVLDELQEWLTALESSNDLDRRFWLQLMKSTSVHIRGSWARAPEYFGIDAGNHRDEQMADNLLWLLDNWYQGRKLIVWSATFHHLRNPSAIDSHQPEYDYGSLITMGHRVWETLGKEVYNLGFTAYEGEAGTWMAESAITLQPATPGSLEDLMLYAGLENAIIDFRGAGPSGSWLSTQRLAKPLGYQEMTADWTSVFDGMFFTRTMVRSTPADPSMLP
jgi:erythromycin esterase